MCDNNTRVCSHHFTKQDFVTSVVEGFGPKRAMLKSDTVPTVFCFLNPAKCRKLNKVRESRTVHHSIIDDLLKEPTKETYSSKKPEPATRDIGIQCGRCGTKYNYLHNYIVSLFDKNCLHI